MAAFSTDTQRNIIPRWRTYEATRRLGELGSLAMPKAHGLVVSDFLESKVVAWQRHRTVGNASDLVGAGITLGREGEVVEAASFLLREDSNVPSWARELAKRALGIPESVDSTVEPEDVELPLLRQRIKSFRELLRIEPNDPITWVELSRCYACVGLSEQAKRSMTVGQQLAKDNRFVLRSASSLWVNLGDPERASDTLLRTDRTRHDPWLLAAEIAISSISGKPSRLASTGRRMLSQEQYSPIHISELASAVATLELSYGTLKKSKRFFGQSLEDPTENSIAQASWASRNYKRIALDLQYLKRPKMFEAETWSHYLHGEWESSIGKCKHWLFDQPFSSSPCILGSLLAAVTLEDYSTSAWFAKRGLMANPSDFSLLNNLTFALANLGELEEAEKTLSKASKLRLSPLQQAVLCATNGLLEFRNGNVARGRDLYLDAQSIAKNIPGTDASRVLAFASAFHAIEEASEQVSNAQPTLSEALRLFEKNSDPIFRVIEHRLRRLASGERAPNAVVDPADRA